MISVLNSCLNKIKFVLLLSLLKKKKGSGFFWPDLYVGLIWRVPLLPIFYSPSKHVSMSKFPLIKSLYFFVDPTLHTQINTRYLHRDHLSTHTNQRLPPGTLVENIKEHIWDAHSDI